MISNHYFVRRIFIIIFILQSVFISSQEKRAALVIGNGAYNDFPKLINPTNDAHDLTSALESLGFEVIKITNANLELMENALQTFKELLHGYNVALFFYSGHGVQIQGENYLLPVNERFSSESTVRSRSISVGQVLDVIRDAQVPTALIFLDACRDNPFYGRTKGGDRGLTVIKTPQKIETMISYATEPGETADDGQGRNSFFTSALLKNIHNPNYEIADLMRSVRADVIESTNGEQRPRIDIGLSKPFYFNSAHESITQEEKVNNKIVSLPLQQSQITAQIKEEEKPQAQEHSQLTFTQNPTPSFHEGYFGLGSMKPEVRTVMGSPDGISVYKSLGEEVWRYSYSTITFDLDGRVTEWDDLANVLKVYVDKPQELNRFTIGSTKSEVTAAMGTPQGIANYEALGKEIWSYSYSTIEFDAQGNVVGWNDIARVLRFK